MKGATETAGLGGATKLSKMSGRYFSKVQYCKAFMLGDNSCPGSVNALSCIGLCVFQ